ncbi:MAG: DUF2680 domain-containing protein [Peptostreptococcaceae bacterium]|nr:DUF2680 domain-containing protein [Peptostreptococcaceae bacterium]
MNKKSMAALFAAGLLSTSAFAFAADANNKPNSSTQSVTTTQSQKQKRELTETEKKEFEARREAMTQAKSKWNALSDSQKQEVYALEEKIIALEKEQIDKLVSLGVMDKTSADAQKKKLDERFSQQKQSGALPFGKAHKGGKGARPGDAAKNASTK